MEDILQKETTLVELLKSGDRLAFNQLYNNYSDAVYGIIFKICNGDENLACDLLQDSFVKIWKNISTYDAAKGRLFTWMLNIARNVCIDNLRSKNFRNSQQNQSIEDSVNVVDHAISTSQKTDLIGIKELVSKLKKDQRDLIDLIYFKGLTQEEAAKHLGIPTGTVKTRIRSALLLLRNVYKSEMQN